MAGDEIWPDDLDLDGSYVMPPEKLRHLEARIGTGLYALGPQIHESNMDARKLEYERLADWVDTTGCGLSGNDARLRGATITSSIRSRSATITACRPFLPAAGKPRCPLSTRWKSPTQSSTIREFWPSTRPARPIACSRNRSPGGNYRRRKTNSSDELLAAIGRAVLACPKTAASSPGDRFDGLLEIPTATVLGHERAELVPTVYLLEPRRPVPAEGSSRSPACRRCFARQPATSRRSAVRSAAASNWPCGSRSPIIR